MSSAGRKQVPRCPLLAQIAKQIGKPAPQGPQDCIPENSPICLKCPHCPPDRTQLGHPPGKHPVAPLSQPTARVGILPSASEPRPKRAGERHPPQAVPPKTVTITLSEEDIIEGRLKATPGLREMLRFYGWQDEVCLVTYGGYQLQARLDKSLDGLAGPDIAEWFRENGLQAGDKVHLEAPSAKAKGPRLYTLHDRGLPAETEQPAAKRDRLWLRHRIYVAFAGARTYLHPQVIAEKVAERDGLHVEIPQVRQALVTNSHLFVRFADTTDLWGLIEWGGAEPGPRVDPVSLLLAIGEDDLVHQALHAASQPLSDAEIARRIAEYFVLPPSEIERLSPVNAADPRLLRLNDGRWGLRSWVSEWTRERDKLQEQLQAQQELATRLERLRREEQALQEAIVTSRRRAPRHWLRRIWEGLVILLVRCLRAFVQRGGSPAAQVASAEERLEAVRTEIAALEAELAATDDEARVRTRLDELCEWLSLVPT